MIETIHPGKLAQIERRFRAFLADTSLSQETKAHFFAGRSYGANAALLSWNSGPYLEAIEAIGQLDLKVSDRTIAKTLSNSMIRLFEAKAVSEDADAEAQAHLDSILAILPDAEVAKEVGNLIKHLAALEKTYTIFIPIAGVRLKDLGEFVVRDVTFHAKESGPMSSLASLDIPKRLLERMDKAFDTVSCYATVETEGDREYATSQALDQVRSAIHILNLFLASSYHRDRRWKKITPVSLDVIHVFLCVPSSIQELDESLARLTLTEQSRDIYDYEITRKRLGEWREWGFDRVVACFEADDPPSEIEAKIRQAIIWYSKGMNSEGVEERFVAVAIALESLLVGKGIGGDPSLSWGSIGQRLADRVAFLVGRNPEDRIRLVGDTKRLYGLRSKIVHEGMTVSRENLYLLERLFDRTFWAFVALAGEKIKSWPDFQQWEKEQKYSVHEQTDERDAPT